MVILGKIDHPAVKDSLGIFSGAGRQQDGVLQLLLVGQKSFALLSEFALHFCNLLGVVDRLRRYKVVNLAVSRHIKLFNLCLAPLERLCTCDVHIHFAPRHKPCPSPCPSSICDRDSLWR